MLKSTVKSKGNLLYFAAIIISINRLIFHVPTRGLLGLRSDLLNETKGTATVLTEFLEYQEFKGQLNNNRKGAIISAVEGVATGYALKDIEAHGTLFIKPGTKVPFFSLNEFLNNRSYIMVWSLENITKKRTLS